MDYIIVDITSIENVILFDTSCQEFRITDALIGKKSSRYEHPVPNKAVFHGLPEGGCLDWGEYRYISCRELLVFTRALLLER